MPYFELADRWIISGGYLLSCERAQSFAYGHDRLLRAFAIHFTRFLRIFLR